MPHDRASEKVQFRVHPDQKVALHRLAAERDVNVTTVLRDAITNVTGVQDPLPRQRRWRRASDSTEEA